MNIEEEYQDVLQNLEGAIIRYYRSNPELIDAQVKTAIERLVKIYGAEAVGKTSSYPAPRGVSGEVANRVKQICEWRLGREKIVGEDEQGQERELEIETLEAKELVECLKRIMSSIKLWTKKGGRQGYLEFVGQFL